MPRYRPGGYLPRCRASLDWPGMRIPGVWHRAREDVGSVGDNRSGGAGARRAKGVAVTVRADIHPAFENLDRIAVTEMRPPTSPAGVVAAFYRLVRSPDEPPLTLQIARRVLDSAPGRALIVTGLVDKDRFPCGEIDGPLGSIALARALVALGHEPTIIVDREAVIPVEAVLREAVPSGVHLRAADFTETNAAREFGAGFDMVFAVEKLGRNAKGHRHLVWGTPVHVGDEFADDYVLGAAAAGALTVGVGDNGNEIGFGNIGAAAEPLTPAGVDADGGFFAATRVDYLLPASVSNFGCYALVAALAIATGRRELALDGETIRRWTDVGLDNGLRSGGGVDVHFHGDDGVPTRFVVATVEMFAGIVHQALLGDPRTTSR